MEDEGYREFAEFLAAAEKGTPLYEFGLEVAGAKEPDPDDGVVRFSDPVTLGVIAAIIVAPAMWAWSSIELQALRARREMETAKKRIVMIEEVKKIIDMPELAEAAVEGALAAVAKRDKDDPVLDGILKAADTFGTASAKIITAATGKPEVTAKPTKEKKGAKKPPRVEKPADKPRITSCSASQGS